VVGNADQYDFRLKSWILLRMPLGLYCHVLFSCFTLLLAKLTFRKGRGEYVKYRMVLSIAREKARELMKAHEPSNSRASR